MTKEQQKKKFKKLLTDRSYLLIDINHKVLTVDYLGHKRIIKALTQDFCVLDNGLYLEYNYLSLKQLVSLYDILFDCYFNSLYYGNVIKYKFRKLKRIGSIVYTSTLNDVSLLKCTLEKYWSDDINIKDSHKVKLVPMNKNFETISLYVSDFKKILKQFI